jgi:hypothetical protein
VLDEDEDLTSPRVIDAMAPSAVLHYQAMYLRGGATTVDASGRAWRETVEAYPVVGQPTGPAAARHCDNSQDARSTQFCSSFPSSRTAQTAVPVIAISR